MMQVSAVSLQGRHASLVPLSMAHHDALVEADLCLQAARFMRGKGEIGENEP